MIDDDDVIDRLRHDRTHKFKHDLALIRQDVVAVLQETANVRASMTEFSSWKPGVSKRFVVVSGLLCFIVISAMVICQAQLQAWLRSM